MYVPKRACVRVGETFLFDFPIRFFFSAITEFCISAYGPGPNSMANMIFCALATYSQFSLQFGLFRLPIHFLRLATDAH